MRIVVSGSSGFIGKHLTKLLINNGEQVFPLDISDGVNVCEWEQVSDIRDFDAIIHLANKTFVPDSYNQPLDFYQTNVLGTLNMLELCRLNNAKFIYLSSYIYGHPQYLPIDEQHPIQAFNPYAQSKVICEEMCKGYSRDFGIPVIVFRPFNIYGKGQNEIFLIPKMIRQAKNGEIVIKDERPKRDYIYIDDVITAIVNSIHFSPPDDFEIFNLGSGKSYSVKEMAEIIISQSPQRVVFRSENEERQNEIMDTIANIDKTKDLLNWLPGHDVFNGIKKMM